MVGIKVYPTVLKDFSSRRLFYTFQVSLNLVGVSIIIRLIEVLYTIMVISHVGIQNKLQLCR